MTSTDTNKTVARCGAIGHHGRCILTAGHDAALAHLYATRATPEPKPDTLAEWLHRRYRGALDRIPWNDMTDDDRAYWEHEAAAVRRAVARGGFKNPIAPGAPAQPDGQEPDCTCGSDDNTHDGGCATYARWASTEGGVQR